MTTTTIKTTLWTAAAAAVVLAGLSTVPAVRAADGQTSTTQPTTKPVNAKCPVTGEDIDSKVTVVYEGKTYAFCCADCVASFNKDPAKYAAKAK